MNRLKELFARKDKDILSVYFTAGFPRRDSAAQIIRALAEGGADMIEVGIPFSDPMADGKTIQHSSAVALRNGMTLPLLLEQVEQARKDCDVPLVLMGYLNPIMQYGVECLLERCRSIGIDGLIVPDLPFGEYMRNYKALCERYGIDLIMLITPETSEERIREIDRQCGGFIYMVSAASTTGTREEFSREQTAYFQRIDGMGLRHPRLIGFGISTPQTMQCACRYSAGGIIGSLFIETLQSEPTPEAAVERLLHRIGRR